MTDITLRYGFAALATESVATIGGNRTAQNITAKRTKQRIVVLILRGARHAQ